MEGIFVKYNHLRRVILKGALEDLVRLCSILKWASNIYALEMNETGFTFYSWGSQKLGCSMNMNYNLAISSTLKCLIPKKEHKILICCTIPFMAHKVAIGTPFTSIQYSVYNIYHSKNGNVTALIWGASPQTRSDRRKDRVETNPEQLAAASSLAERMTISTGRTTRVIGWYHSHPHITVLPSHVDVRTQAMYQLLDSGFIGLIFSCYSEDANKVGRIQAIAFQSSDRKQNQMSRSIPASPLNRSSVIDLDPSPSSSGNVSIRSGSFKAESPDQDTGDSKVTGTKGGGRSSDLGNFFANADAASYLGREKGGGNYNSNILDTATVDVDPMDMSESMQEAMHRSNLDMSGAEYVRKEIPLYVLPTSSLINIDSPLSSYTDLQHVLFDEERTAYNQAILQNMRDGKVHPLTFIHHTSTYQASLCKLIEYCLSPAMQALQDRLRENEIRLAVLSDEATSLEGEAFRQGEAGSVSPRQVQSHIARNVPSPGSRSRKGY